MKKLFRMAKSMLNNSYTFAMFSRICSILFGLFYTILLSRYLGAELRGEYSIIQNYANIAASVIGMGICLGYPYFKRKRPENSSKKLFKSFSGNLFALFVIYAVIFWMLAFALPVNGRIRMTLVIVPIVFLYKQISYIVLIETPRRANLADMLLGITDLVIVVLLMILTQANLLYCYLFLVLDKGIYAAVAVRNTRLNPLKTVRIDTELKKYISYGMLPMLTDLLMTFNYKVDIIMLSLFKNVTTAEIGVYSVGVMLAEKVWLLPDVLSNIMQSKLASGKREDEVAKICRISVWVTIVCLAGMALIGKPFIRLAYGLEYSGAYQITMIILLGVLGMVFYKVIYSYNVVVGKKRINFILLAFSVILNVILNTIMISANGTIGAAYASLISFVFCGFLYLVTFCYAAKITIIKMLVPDKQDLELLKALLPLASKKSR